MEEEKQEYLKQGYNVIMDIPLLFENELENTGTKCGLYTLLKYTNGSFNAT